MLKIKHMNGQQDLSRRERQVMEILYRMDSASVEQIRSQIPNPPSYSAVRVTINVLERKGHVRHAKRGRRYVYTPTTPRRTAVQGAVRSLLRTYFDDSLRDAMAAMLDLHSGQLSDAEIVELAKAIRKRRKGGSK